MTKIFDKIRVTSRQKNLSVFISRDPKLLLTLVGLVFIAVPARTQTLPEPATANRPSMMIGPVQTAPTAAMPVPAPAVAQQDQLPDQGATAEPAKPAAPKPPHVTYKAGQLTISAENSTLSDILASLRTATGAEIDMPPAAAGDHLWVNLGPGPARKVLADLLSETRLDFIIQASDSDGIRSVSLTRRTDTPSVTARVMTPSARPLPARQSDAERRVPVRASAESHPQEETVAPEAQETNISTDAASVAAAPVAAAPVAAATAPVQATIADPAAAAATSTVAATEPSKAPASMNPMFQTLQDLYAARKQMQTQTAPAPSAAN